MTDDFIFEIMEKFNSSNIVDLDLNQNGAHLLLRKKKLFFLRQLKLKKEKRQKVQLNLCSRKKKKRQKVQK